MVSPRGDREAEIDGRYLLPHHYGVDMMELSTLILVLIFGVLCYALGRKIGFENGKVVGRADALMRSMLSDIAILGKIKCNVEEEKHGRSSRRNKNRKNS